MVNFFDNTNYDKINNKKFTSYVFTESDFWFIESGKVGRTSFEKNNSI